MTPANTPPAPSSRDVFLKALDIADATRRRAYLDEACAGQPDLRAEVDALLANHKEDSFLEHASFEASTTVHNPAAATSAAASETRATAPPFDTVRYFGDYELIKEIAQGGMGVVYKARQTSLNRTVAVKMIRGAQLANEPEVKRFRTEAEAAAKLQHPNIVAIHEVGEHQGRHYFSMDFVDGPTLADLVRTGPLPAGRAAHYLKTIAETVEYAHQQGILHRDLKPSNVLLDREDRPRITDFGLAKFVNEDSNLTHTGEIMGSPAYMAPEQAQGKQSRVGAASDVYSLGAVLYHLLTGKPPFKGETVVDTLRLVLDEEPVRPSELNPKVPSDLETICLKCLQKEPGQRYASARELADEIERFLNYEPILAKPAGGLRRTWNWTQKNPWVFTAAFASLVLVFASLAYGLWERTNYYEWRQNVKVDPGQAGNESPAVLFFQAFPLLCVLLYVAANAFRRSYRQQSVQGTLPLRTQLLAHAGLGMLGIISGMGLMFAQIKSWAWGGAGPALLPLEILTIPCAAALNWIGFYMLWEAVGVHESSRFRNVVDKALEKQLQDQARRWPLHRLVMMASMVCVSTLLVLSFVLWVPRAKSVAVLVAAVTLLVTTIVAYTVVVSILKRRDLLRFAFLPLSAFLIVAYVGFRIADAEFFADSRHGHPGASGELSFVEDAPNFAMFALAAVLGCLVAVAFGLIVHRRSSAAVAAFPGRPWRQGLTVGMGLLGLLVATHVIENWLAKRAWIRCKKALEARGENMNLKAYVQPPVSDSENALEHPFMKQPMEFSLPRGLLPKGVSLQPMSLAAARQLSATAFPRSSILDREGKRGSIMTRGTVRFESEPLSAIVRKLAAQSGVAVVIGNGFPFFDGPLKPHRRTFAATNVTVIEALDQLLREYNVSAEFDDASGAYVLKPVVLSRPELTEFYDAFDPQLRQFGEAFDRPHVRFPYELESAFDRQAVSPIPTYVSMRTMAQMLGTRCALHLANGDRDAALADLGLMQKVMRWASAERSVIGAMIHVAIAGLYASAVEDSIRAGVWTPTHLAALQSQMASIDLLTPLADAIDIHRASVTDVFNRAAENFGVRRRLFTQQDSSATAKAASSMMTLLIPRGVFYRNMVEAAGLVEHIDHGIDPIRRRIDAPRISADENAAARSRGWSTQYTAWARRGAVNFEKALQTMARQSTAVHMAIIACALERFRGEHGAYPETLESLTSRFLIAVPHDLFDGESLRYRRLAGGTYELYSIGWNSRDDAAALPAGSSADAPQWQQWKADAGDWAWRGVPGK